MKTYELLDSEDRLFAFEINNSGIGRHGVCRVIEGIPGTRLTRKPKFLSWFREDSFCDFEVDGETFVVEEPFGDNSRYWIGPQPPRWLPQTERVRDAFANVRGLRVLRWLGFLLGVAFVAFGIWFLGADVGRPTLLVSLAMIGTGTYFINYALTGRSTILRRSRKN